MDEDEYAPFLNASIADLRTDTVLQKLYENLAKRWYDRGLQFPLHEESTAALDIHIFVVLTLNGNHRLSAVLNLPTERQPKDILCQLMPPIHLAFLGGLSEGTCS